jgi:hypothetical protein
VRVGAVIEERSLFKSLDKADPAILDRFGDGLQKVFENQRKMIASQRELARIYIADCKRLGIEPRKINLAVM